MEKPLTEIQQIPAKRKLYYFIAGVIITGIIALGIILYFGYKKGKEDQAVRQKAEQYQKEHEAFVADSLAEVQKQKAAFDNMVSLRHRYDSARSTLRFKPGDIVFLKPDSLKGVVTTLTADSTLTSYTYFILLSNKGTDPAIVERKDQLLY